MPVDARDVIDGLLDSEHQGSIGTPAPDVPPGTWGGTDGDDTLVAGPGGETIAGGDGNDLIKGGAGDDLLFGGAGDDTIRGGDGNDTIVGDGGDTQTVTIRFDGSNAGFLNSLGAYYIDPETGEIRGVTLLTENVSVGFAGIGDTVTFTAPAGSQIGLFLIADGGSRNDFAGLGSGRFEFRNADGTPATLGSTAPQLVFVADDGSVTALNGDVFHTAGFGPNVALNGDGLLHTDGIAGGDGSVSFGFEDIFGLGDGDFNDLLLTVSIEGAGSFPNAHFPLDIPASPFIPGDDSLTGGAGDDVIFGGGGDDTLAGGPGADTVYGGADRDTIIGATPGDVIDGGGDGEDLDTLDLRGGPPVSVVIVGEDGESGLVFDRTTGGDARFYEIEEILTDPDAGPDGIVRGRAEGTLIDRAYVDADGDRIDAGDNIFPGRSPDDDIVVGQGGNDTISSFDGDDLVVAGGGDDIVDAGSGRDTVYGGAGDDSLDGGAGDDTLFGGSGNDTLAGGAGDDDLYGGSGDDSLAGGEGDDTLRGETGNDRLDGGSGNDQLFGGAGDDTLNGGPGDDTLDGGDDRDTFRIDSILGVTQVFGGSGGDDFDRLDLSGLPRGAWRLASSSPDSDGNGTDGVIELLDGDGAVTGRVIFENIEQIVPCFTPGTLIATPRGERPIEELRVGDKVLTRDNGIQEIRWIGSRTLDHHALLANPHLRPVLIRKGSLGNGLPERDMLVSPNHRVLVANDRTALYFDEHEVLVAAKHLVAGEGMRQIQSSGTTYVHFMFDRHEVVLSNGAWTESFQPGDYTLAGMGNAQRNEIFEIFPELRNRTGQKSYAAARKTLKGFEARLLAR